MTNKHNHYDLVQMQSLPLEAKILMTQQRIRQWYDYWHGQVYVSFSGGKDSTVLKHIVDSMYDDVPSLFVNTGLEYPEIQKFARDIKTGIYNSFNGNVQIVRPEMRFDEVISKYGYPVISKDVAQSVFDVRTQSNRTGLPTRQTKLYSRRFDPESDYCKKYPSYGLSRWDFLFDAPYNVSHKCCDVMKKKPAKHYEKETGRKAIVGTLASESRMRYTTWLRQGCNAFTKDRPTSQPLSFWTEQDILEYLVKYEVPYCSVYGDIKQDDTGKYYTTGYDRTGCIFCAFGCHLQKTPNDFQKLKETHPRQYEYCINGGEMVDGKWQPSKEGLGLGKVLDYIGVDYE